MRLLLSIIFLSVLCSCGRDHPPSEKVNIASKVRSDAAKKLRDEMGLIPIGFGGQMMDQIKWLELSFQYRHPIDIKEGRKAWAPCNLGASFAFLVGAPGSPRTQCRT